MSLEKYLQIRKKIQTGDLLSWTSSNITGYAIRLFTKGQVNHSSTAINLTKYGGDRKFCTEAMEPGCELNNLSQRLDNFKGSVYWHQLRPEFEIYRHAIGVAAFSRIGYDYDYASIFKQIFGKVSISAKKLFCSEYVYLNMIDAKVPLSTEKKAPNPQELFTNRIFWHPPILIKGKK